MLQSCVDLDDDADGKITKTELRKILQTMGEPMTDEECDAFFEMLAADEGFGDAEAIGIDALSKKLLPKLEVNLLAARNADASVSQINDSHDQLAAAEPIPED